MKKTLIIGITVLTIAAACGPVTADAAVNRISYTNAGNKRIVKVVKNCNQKELLKKLQELGIKGDCIFQSNINSNGNCPIFPENGGIIIKPDTGNNKPDNENNKPDNGNNKPDNGNKPDTEKPEEDNNASYASQVVKLVNKERAKEGLSPLSADSKIESAATVRAKEIQKSFSHTRPNGTGFSTALKEADVTFRGSGENIAWGQKSPEEVVKTWMNSPSHRANIMNKNYKNIGVGHLKNASGVSYWVQLFTY